MLVQHNQNILKMHISAVKLNDISHNYHFKG